MKKFSFFAFAFLLGASYVCAADSRIEQGARFEAKGAYEKALGEYRSMLAENPKNSEAYLLAARVRMKMKDYNGAVANYRLAYRYDENLGEAYEGAAKAFELMGQKAKANAERAKAPKGVLPAASKEPAKTEPVKAAPVSEVPAAKSEPAKAEDDKSVVEDPFERGKELLAKGRYEEAAPMWRAVLSKKPGFAGAYYYAGVTRYEMGEYDKAEFNLKKGLGYKDLGNDANYYLAMVYLKTDKPDLEKKSLKAYLKKAAPDGRFRRKAEARIAEIEAQEERANAKAVKAEDVASKNEPSKSQKNTKVKDEKVATTGNSIANANQLFAEGDFENALKMYKELLDTDLSAEERYFAMLQMGNIYRELRDFHSAVTRYRDVVKEYPDSDWATEAERVLEDAVWLEKHSNELPRKR